MGKTKTDFTLTKPNSPASKGRTYALYCAVGVDVRETDLTNKQAHTLLDRANTGEPYQVRKELLELGGARAAKQDVAKELRKFKPKKKSKAKAEHTDDELAILLKMLKKRPELIKAALADAAAQIDDEDDEKPKPKPKAKPKAAAKKTGTKVRTKSAKQVAINEDDDISDEDLLSMLAGAMKQAV